MIATFAGGGVGDGGLATAAPLAGTITAGQPEVHGLAVDGPGDVLVATSAPTYTNRGGGDAGFDRVRRIDVSSGRISTVAGGDSSGFSGDGGPATAAQLAVPTDVATDAAGNMYILDAANQRVRKRSVGTGSMTTVAGSGGTLFGLSGDGGPATKARLALFSEQNNQLVANFYIPMVGLAVNATGDLFINDLGNNRVRRVDGRTGIITTVAGNGNHADGKGDGGAATAAAITAADVAVDRTGNLYIAEGSTNACCMGGSSMRVRRVDAATGIISTVAGGGSPVDGLGDGLVAPAAAMNPQCVTLDAAGDMFICDGSNGGRIRRVDAATKIIATVAGGGSPSDGLGDGGPALAAALSPQDVGVDGIGDLFITSHSFSSDGPEGRLRRVDAHSGLISTIAGGATRFGEGGPAASANLTGPTAVAVAAGATFIGDQRTIRKVDALGIITAFAGGGHPADGVGDNGPATAASLAPVAIATDPAGNVFLVDGSNATVRRIDARTQVIRTVAGGGNPADGLGDGGPAISATLSNQSQALSPSGLFVVGPGNAKWPAGTLLIADGSRVRSVDSSGTIATVAGNGRGDANGAPTFGGDGGPAIQAGVDAADVVADPAGSLFIADRAASRIRRVDAQRGIITSVAGDGAFGLAGIGGPAIKAHLNHPVGLALDRGGNVYISDGYMRVVELDSAGNLEEVAGTGVPGFGGDGGPAVDADLLHVGKLAVDGAGNVLIADTDNFRVRLVTPGAPHPPAGCGEVITASTTLAADLGPCPRAGIIVGADHITLNLNGHRIFGAPTAQDGQYAGVIVSGRNAVTVTGGQVDHFSEGVAILNSTNVSVSHMTIRDNIGSYDLMAFGDGIVLYYAAHNRVLDNNMFNNGPYDNLAVLGRTSDYNLLQGNRVADSFSLDNGGINGVGEDIHFNAFSDPTLPDRGASLLGNQAVHNTVLNAYAEGISNRANTHAQIIGNTVSGSGVGDQVQGIGIGVNQLGQSTPLTQNLIQGNTVINNARDGIQDGTKGNRFINNTATGNVWGIFPGFDLSEGSAGCATAVWQGNTYGTINQPCIGANGHHVNGPPTAPTNASPTPGTARMQKVPPFPVSGRLVRGG